MEINDNNIRPLSFKDFVGHEDLKYKLKIYVSCALKRHETLDHILFYGSPGVGKTTLANVIANEMHSKLVTINGASVEKVSDIVSSLLSLSAGDILFIDEIHRLPAFIQEILYSAMEDYSLDIIPTNISDGGHPVHIDLPPFTLIGATTSFGSLTGPLRNRFAIIEYIDIYTIIDMCEMVKRLNKIYQISMDDITIRNLASRTRGVPRTLVSIYKRIRDFYSYDNNKDSLNNNKINEYFKILKIDPLGLTQLDYKYLNLLTHKYKNMYVGIELLAFSLNESEKTIENLIEPYLLRIGFIERTKKGRIATNKCFNYLNKINESNNKK